jgi:predicted ATPase
MITSSVYCPGAGTEAAMIESIEFSNFKALRATTLPLTPFTLLLGPNGSGKSTVLQAIRGMALWCKGQKPFNWSQLLSASSSDREAPVKINCNLRRNGVPISAQFVINNKNKQLPISFLDEKQRPLQDPGATSDWLSQMQVFALDSAAISQPVIISSESLKPNGHGLAAVLDDLKDKHADRWEALLSELREWLPEFDQILFDKPEPGHKRICLRTKRGGHRIPAEALSDGTLIALALLTLAYIPNPPTVIGLEEIDRGLHPRLMRHLQDALYRLSYPDGFNESRPPIQVIATTHSPYLLELFRDHPEEIVLANKAELDVKFERLSDIEHFNEILGESALGDVWYSGVFGGVAVKP